MSIEGKICPGCKTYKLVSEYSVDRHASKGLRSKCRLCAKAYLAKYRAGNSEKIKAYSAKYYINNVDAMRAKQAKRRELYPEKVNASNAKYSKKRRLADPLYKAAGDLRNLIRQALDKRGFTKTSRVEDLLGADFLTVHEHLIHTAIKNYGFYDPNITYHKDHMIPCSFANTLEELEILQSYTNLQLLTPEDNLRKSNNLDWQIL